MGVRIIGYDGILYPAVGIIPHSQGYGKSSRKICQSPAILRLYELIEASIESDFSLLTLNTSSASRETGHPPYKFYAAAITIEIHHLCVIVIFNIFFMP